MLKGMRLLMTADAVGGVWTYALDLSAGLVRVGARVTLAILGPPASPLQERQAEAAGIALRHTGAQPEWLAPDTAAVETAARRLADLVRDESAEMLHLNHPALAAFAPWPCPVVGVAHSCVATWWTTVRGTPLPEDFAWRTRLVDVGYRRVDRLVAPSHAFATATQAAYRLPQSPIVIPNGRRAPPESHAAPTADLVFSAGRLWDEGKGIAILDQAAAVLPCAVEVAGPCEGPNGSRIDIRNAIALGEHGSDAVAARLARRPIFASPALYEPFGLSVLEAAQAGCALVLADIPTFRELWEGAALFVPPRDAGALAEAAWRLLDDPTHRAARGEAAARRAAAFGLEPLVASTSALYATLTSRSAA